MTQGDLLYLSREDVEAAGVDMAASSRSSKPASARRPRAASRCPPKPGIHPQPDAFIHAMPAYIGGMQSAGVKWVGRQPANPARGLPYILRAHHPQRRRYVRAVPP